MTRLRFRSFTRHVLNNLRGGFLVRPLIMALSLGLLGAVLSSMEVHFPIISAWVPHGFFPTHTDHTVAQVILTTIAQSVMTVVSIVFAILLMSLTLASTQFSPRILVGFSRDIDTQRTLGIYLGTFSYCVAALPAARSFPVSTAPVVTVLGAMWLALVCVAWLLYFIHHISQAISVNFIVDRLATETEGIIRQLMPRPRRSGPTVDPLEDLPPLEGTPIRAKKSGYIRYVDFNELVEVTTQGRLEVEVVRRIGHFVPEGAAVMIVSQSNRSGGLRSEGKQLDDGLQDSLLSLIDLGQSRTLEQDIEFGILQIVDIALKAISPAVNDPSTAVTCVDQLSRILIRFAAQDAPQSAYYDAAHRLRVRISWLSLDRLLDSAFQQIRLYSQSDLAVSLRILRALTDIATTLDDPRMKSLVLLRGERVVEGCAPNFEPIEMAEIEARMALLRQACLGQVSSREA